MNARNELNTRKHLYLIIDTETAGNISKGETLVYDIGAAVIDNTGKIYKHISVIIDEVFYGMPDRMNTAYYSKKIPMYIERIRQNKTHVVNIEYARGLIEYMCSKYECKAIIAHNMYFDNNALNYTYHAITGKTEKFLPNLPKWCTWTMSKQTVAKQKKYITWCKENGYVCKNKQVKTTAEVLYRYMTSDNTFLEKHTGIDDIVIESKIFAWIIRQHKAMRRTYYKEN